MSSAPDWLTARPIAHRGLHDRAAGRIENSLSAARAAIDAGYSIECDVEATADGEAVVFHDADLTRLTGLPGLVRERTAAELGSLPLLRSMDTIPTLPVFLATVAGRVPLVIEVKSRFDGDLALLSRVGACLASYDGPAAVKSFDPAIVAAAVTLCPGRPRGIVAQADYADWPNLPPVQGHALANLLHWPETQPDFLSWRARDLPCAAPFLSRLLGQRPVLTWTVRSSAERDRVTPHADQIVFEGFRP